MPTLNSQQRNTLEEACVRGRRAAEQAVRAALTSLAITAERPPTHLSEEDRQLRRGLRAKARQLGDQGDNLDLLIAECAYEQWHRLLFARFLAENNLLIHPQYQATVSLADCDELAGMLGEPDGWSVAARFAAEILPGIFRLDDPCVRVRLAPEGRLSLEGVVAGLPQDIFACDDALGWCYQFWQKIKKDEINASERKVGGADLGPVTQLFTEDYMVRFLLENTLGAWWAARRPHSPLVEKFQYLRITGDGDPASGTFSNWPCRISDVTVMDPCCGSGHFLVEAFSMLWQMRAEEEGLPPVEAQDLVLRDNLFGLELDSRCVQIAMFALALHAWKTGGGWRKLPIPNIACSGIPVRASLDEWSAFAGDDTLLQRALARLHDMFRDADTLGSLIDPVQEVESTGVGHQGSLDDIPWDNVMPLLMPRLNAERGDPATAVLGFGFESVGRAAEFLSHNYTLVVTNVPYLRKSAQCAELRLFCEQRYRLGSTDLATVCLLRFLELTARTVALVLPQHWLYLSSYEDLRRKLLDCNTWQLVVRLGPGAFEGISGEVVNVALFICDRDAPAAEHKLHALDLNSVTTPAAKARAMTLSDLFALPQKSLLANPQARMSIEDHTGKKFLKDYAVGRQGIKTGDDGRYRRRFWEVPAGQRGWSYFQSTVERTLPFGGRTDVVLWEDGAGSMARSDGSRIVGREAWGRSGVMVSQMGSLPVSLYTGDLFDTNASPLIPNNPADLGAIWHFCSSPLYPSLVREIDASLKVTNRTLADVPFDIERWRRVALEAPPLPEPRSDDPTQWLFGGRPESSTAPLHVAVARLVGYRWPEQADSDDLDDFVDSDGIVCLPSVGGESPAAARLQQLLSVAFAQSWSTVREKELLTSAGSNKNLADWLRDEFFKGHCALFENRPFVWHIWDGQRDGFAALVNYHRLDRKALEKLTYTYLGDWIERQRAEVRDDVAGAEGRLAAASKLRKTLELILLGEPPYDIYVRWKSLAEQPIGWDPDVNDGVRLNVRPFVEAGVLRARFNVHWRQDRGKNADGSNRLNDLHFTAAEKRATRTGAVRSE